MGCYGGFASARLCVLEEMQELFARVFVSLNHYFAHEFRAAHESTNTARLLKLLDEEEGGIFVTMDWKMKFLSYVYRESQSDFFGKRGYPWHGVMASKNPASLQALESRSCPRTRVRARACTRSSTSTR